MKKTLSLGIIVLAYGLSLPALGTDTATLTISGNVVAPDLQYRSGKCSASTALRQHHPRFQYRTNCFIGGEGSNNGTGRCSGQR